MKTLSIRLYKQQLVNDVRVECSLLARALQRTAETSEQGDDIANVLDDVTLPVVARALTEGFGKVKEVCQRYLVMGRETDDNRLERLSDERRLTEYFSGTGRGGYDLLAGTTYTLEVESDGPVTVLANDGSVAGVTNGRGTIVHTPKQTGPVSVEAGQAVTLVYVTGSFGSFDLELSMPDGFNQGVSESVKSYAHRVIVDYVMFRVLSADHPEASGTWYARMDSDMGGLRTMLQARLCWGRSAADWS